MSSTTNSGYATLREVKRRLNIPDSVTATDQKINDDMKESDNYVNTQINLHALTPIEVPDAELVSLSSSLAAALFNFWQTPVKDQNLKPIDQWKKAIQDHILAVYGRKNPNLLTGGEMFGKTSGFNTRLGNGITSN